MKRTPMTRTAFKSAPVKEAKRRTRKCATCRAVFEPRSMTHKCCKSECAQALVALEKARKDRKERQAGLAKLKRRADYLKEAQTAFNSYIRMRDRDKPCISSGVPLTLEAVGGGFDCGHYRSVGSAPHLRFDERNAHGQTKKDNRYLSGNAISYRAGLIARIGLAEVEALEADDTPRKWTVPELIEIKKHYSALVRAAKKGE